MIVSQMKSKLLALNLFLVGILLSSLVYSSEILDFTVTPRLICISVTLLGCLLFIWSKKETLIIKPDIVLLAYFGFVFYSCLSTLWAHTISEAIFENTKVIVSFTVFILAYYALKKDKEYTLTLLCLISIILVLTEAILVSVQLSDITSFNKEALYTIYGTNSHKNLVSSFLFINLFFLII